MFFGFIVLLIIYLLHEYITAWIRYYNKTDKRFGDSVWRWSYDYQVKGVRDVSDLDDKEFVRKRRISCLLYTSPSPRDNRVSRMPSSA